MQAELYQILEYKDGIGKNGKWMKQSFVVKTFDQYPKHLSLTVWGESVELIQSLKIYDRIEFTIEIQSREYQGRWYTDLTAHLGHGKRSLCVFSCFAFLLATKQPFYNRIELADEYVWRFWFDTLPISS